MDKQDDSACNGMEGDTTKEDCTEGELECEKKSMCAKTNALKVNASIYCTVTNTDGNGDTECHENGNIEADNVVASKLNSPEKIAANDLLNFVLTKSGQHLNEISDKEKKLDSSKTKQDAQIANGDIVKNGDVDDRVTTEVLEEKSENAPKNSDACLLNGVPETGKKFDENEVANCSKETAIVNGEVVEENCLDGVETAIKEPDKEHEATQDKSEPNEKHEATQDKSEPNEKHEATQDNSEPNEEPEATHDKSDIKEHEATQDNSDIKEHEATQDNSDIKEHEATQDNSDIKGHESTQDNSDTSQLETKMELDESQESIGKLREDSIGELREEPVGELREESMGNVSQESMGELREESMGNVSQESMGELRVSTSDDTGLTDSKNMSVDEMACEPVEDSSDTNVTAKHLTETTGTNPGEYEISPGVEDHNIEKESFNESAITCSSGPPSLTKEVNCDDNSVVSELDNTEEQNDVQVPNITGPDPNGSVEIFRVIEHKKHISDTLNTTDRLDKDMEIADEQLDTLIIDEQNLVAASEEAGEELKHNEHEELSNNEKELVTAKDEKGDLLVNCKETIKLSEDEIVKKLVKDEQVVIKYDEKEKTNQVPDGAVASVKSPSKLFEKSLKLDQLLSKITNKAEMESQKPKPAAVKQGKARKSCASGNNVPVMAELKPKPTAQSLTSLTFNVKELEKQGVLDIPKASKRKAFDPVKIPSPEQQIKPNQPPVDSPKSKSPGKSKTGVKRKFKRKKGRKMGSYKLPGELKIMKKGRKKESEERQIENEIENASKPSPIAIDSERSTSGNHSDLLQTKSNVSNDKTQSGLMHTQSAVISNPTSPDATLPGSGGVLVSQQINALDMLTKNYKRSFSAAQPSSKKARKTVRQGIDPNTHRTLDSFLKAGSHTQIVSSGRKKLSSDSQQEGSDLTNSGGTQKEEGLRPNEDSSNL